MRFDVSTLDDVKADTNQTGNRKSRCLCDPRGKHALFARDEIINLAARNKETAFNPYDKHPLHFERRVHSPITRLLERFSYDLEKWFWYSVRYLFHQPISEKIKTRTLRFPTKENPNMVKALFDWPIVLQYDVKAKYRLISRKFLGMTFFHPSVRLTNQKPRAFVSVR